MNKKITSSALAALMIAGSTSFSAFAAMSNGTVVIGNKAFDLAYANDAKNLTEITNAMVAGGAIYVKNFDGNWINNLTGTTVAASVIPAVTYKNATGVVTNYPAEDKDAAAVTVTNTGAKTLKASFSGEVTDTSKVVFTVKQGTADVKNITTKWNAAKTEAILENASNLQAGDYTVNVMNGTTDLGTTKITVTQQKVAKINITSTKLGISSVKKTGVEFNDAYATYQVLDQYGNDITSSSLANSITFKTGVGSVNGKNGTITVSPTMNILQFTTVTITAYDTNTGTNANAILPVSSQVGTLSDIKLLELTNVDGKVLTAEDTSALFYITYTATDISGNPTTDYDIVKSGLILNDNDELTSGSSYVTTKVVHDPKDSKKAAIQVQIKNATDVISMDMDMIITAMTYTGKSSPLNVKLRRAAKIDSIQLQIPSYNIATGEDKEIPFVAVDQNGKVLTKYSDIVVDGVSISGAFWSKNANGDAILRIGTETGKTGRGEGYSTDGQRVITATVSSSVGKYNSITINIQKKVAADSLKIDTTVFKTIMQAKQASGAAARQTVDFGWDNEGLSVLDQYDREIDMTTGDGSSENKAKYRVEAVSSNSSVIDVKGVVNEVDTNLAEATTGKTAISITAGVQGSATVTFKLYSNDATKSDGTARDISVPVDTQTQTFSVLQNSDIKNYVIEKVEKPIFIDVERDITSNTQLTDRQKDYKADPEVFGKTSSGAEVKLAGTPIRSASVSNKDFMVYSTDEADSIRIVAKKLTDPTKTTSSAVLTVNVMGTDGDIHAIDTPITSSTVDPIEQSIDLIVETSVQGISKINDTVTLKQSAGNTYADMLGQSLAKFNADGKLIGTKNVYIRAKDQYGKSGMALSQFMVVKDSTTRMPGSTFNVTADGTITGIALPGDAFTITASSPTKGLLKTVKLVFAGSSVGPVDVEAAKVTAATDAVKIAETSKTNATRTAAQVLVNGLVDAKAKTDLQDRIAKIVTAEDVIAAEAAAVVKLDTAKAAEAKLKAADYVDYSAVTKALALPEVTTADKTAKTDAINVAIAALAKKPLANELSGLAKSFMGADYAVITLNTVKAADITKISIDGTVLDAKAYGLSGNDFKIMGVTKTSVVVITAAGTDYKVIMK
ncbi:hypothetical protein [Clostridium tagluense]|uniref:hypothetical protein n=1 Tax=Clostridium tagluense TaxID=360422 RepID=UPI001C6E09D7|nr:hypothetical protein [Clostridium tagluense]MBW9157016.1 hypothetical protein [Clostridium tagluense]WLC65003.1 hypothetical protein KTC93_19510 [Clostridium tagluense]